MTDERRSLEEINDRVLGILVRELGPTDTARFIEQFMDDREAPTTPSLAALDDLTPGTVASPIHDGHARR